MTTRNTTSFLVTELKKEGVECIVPNSCVRMVLGMLDSLPEDWGGLSRDALIKRIRHACELAVTTGLVIRKRKQGIQGYVYEITI